MGSQVVLLCPAFEWAGPAQTKAGTPEWLDLGAVWSVWGAVHLVHL